METEQIAYQVEVRWPMAIESNLAAGTATKAAIESDATSRPATTALDLDWPSLHYKFARRRKQRPRRRPSLATIRQVLPKEGSVDAMQPAVAAAIGRPVPRRIVRRAAGKRKRGRPRKKS
jgi:hypothetical protein